METKKVILARFMDFDVSPSIFLAIICLNFTISTIFFVNNSHRAIKVHVDKVQYCRAGHKCALPISSTVHIL